MPSTRVRGHVVRAAARPPNIQLHMNVPAGYTYCGRQHMKQLVSSQTPDSVSGSIQLPSPRSADGCEKRVTSKTVFPKRERDSPIEKPTTHNWTSENDCVFYQHCRLVGHQMGALGSHISFTHFEQPLAGSQSFVAFCSAGS